MRLLNAAIAVASAIAGTYGASVAYGSLNTPPVGHTEPLVAPVMLTHYLPCEPPAKLTDGVCVTTVVKTVVKTPKPIVIVTVDRHSSSKGKATTTHKAPPKHDDGDDHGDDGDDHGGDDHEGD